MRGRSGASGSVKVGSSGPMEAKPAKRFEADVT
jgi:hypothetical protein